MDPCSPLARKGIGIDPAFREEMWRIMRQRKQRDLDKKRQQMQGPLWEVPAEDRSLAQEED